MGLLSSIGKIVKKAAPVVGGLVGGPAGSILGTAGSLIGSSAKEVAAGTASYYGGLDARDLQIAQALRQMEFQQMSSAQQYRWTKELAADAYNRSKYLSDTAWQRGMADMKAAGLNPILAYKQGPASTPSIGMGSVGLQSGAMAGINDIVTPAIGSAQNVKQTQGMFKKMEEETRLLSLRGNTEIQNEKLTRQNITNMKAAFHKTVSETVNIRQLYELQAMQINKTQAEAKIAQKLAENAEAVGATNVGQLIPSLAAKIVEVLYSVKDMFTGSYSNRNPGGRNTLGDYFK